MALKRSSKASPTPAARAAARRLVEQFTDLSEEDLRFLEGWFAADKSLREAVEAVERKAMALGVVGLRPQTISFTSTDEKAAFAVDYYKGRWDSTEVKKGRPTTADRRRLAARTMRSAKKALKPVAASLRRHCKRFNNPTLNRKAIWTAVERDCPAARQLLERDGWQRLVEATDLKTFTTDGLAVSFVQQVFPEYRPSVLSKLGRTGIQSPKR